MRRFFALALEIPTRTMIRSLFIALLLLAACPALSASNAAVDEAWSLFEAGEFVQALERLNTYLSDQPNDTDARFLKGVVLANKGDIPEAFEVFEALTRDHPELPEPYNNLAVLYAAEGRYEDARKALEQAINTHPSYATAHENLGDIFAMMAADAYDRALTLNQMNYAAQAKLDLVSQLFSRNQASNLPLLSTAGAPAPATPPTPEQISEEPPAAPTPPALSEGETQSIERDVLATAEAWASAWSAKETDSYLSYYSNDFRPPQGMSRTAWESVRRQRLTKPRFIEVKLLNPSVTVLGKDRAAITFTQVYNSDTYSDRTKKALQMVRSQIGWDIVREDVLQ